MFAGLWAIAMSPISSPACSIPIPSSIGGSGGSGGGVTVGLDVCALLRKMGVVALCCWFLSRQQVIVGSISHHVFIPVFWVCFLRLIGIQRWFWQHRQGWNVLIVMNIINILISLEHNGVVW